MASAARAAMTVLLVGSLAMIVAATTMPWGTYYVGHAHWAAVEWVPFSRRFRPDDVILNVLLFVPFGFAALRTTLAADADNVVQPSRSIAVVLAIGCLVSIGVEWFQVYCHGRMPTTVDVLSNTLGTWAGTRLASRGR